MALKLTEQAFQMAVDEAHSSIVARVALATHLGEAQDWPTEFRETSVDVFNEKAESSTLAQ